MEVDRAVLDGREDFEGFIEGMAALKWRMVVKKRDWGVFENWARMDFGAKKGGTMGWRRPLDKLAIAANVTL